MKKNNYVVTAFFYLFFLLIPFIFIGCLKGGLVQSINETNLFTIPYGVFEEQLSVSNLNNVGYVAYGIYMRDGFFYIVNGESGKILELNSYGDLLSIFYNDETNSERKICYSP